MPRDRHRPWATRSSSRVCANSGENRAGTRESCTIGSVKSTVGHLLTGAGAAAVAKVLLAFKNETRPPQANFATPAPGLRYADGPFRVLCQPERWEQKGGARCAVPLSAVSDSAA